MEGVIPLLVRVLAGNSVTSATILACLNTDDARHVRQLHPAVAGTVAAIPWCDTGTPVVDTVRWRAGLPGAVGARLAPSAGGESLTSELAVAALGGVAHLDLQCCKFVTDDLLHCLPTALRALNVRHCEALTSDASFAHLTALVSLDCSETAVVSRRTDGLPPSLQELDIHNIPVDALLPGASLAHLRQLRVLRASHSAMDVATLASLPPSLEELHAAACLVLTPAASFAHLTALHKLDVARSAIGDGSLAAMPPSLAFLSARGCKNLTPAAALPHLPALRLLDVSGTAVGDALVGSLPASLIELRLAGCRGVTAGARLDHLRALRELHCIDTELAPTALAGCRASGCAVPTAGMLRGHDIIVVSLVLLGNGRLASRDLGGVVRLWDAAAGGEATAVLTAGDRVSALVALRDGRLAIGTNSSSWVDGRGCVGLWNVDGVRRATINCGCAVWALAVLGDGRLAAGGGDGEVLVIDVDVGALVTTLSGGHTRIVTALEVLPNGALASGSLDASVRVWDVGGGACVATLTGHTGNVWSLAVLSDGRLASRAGDGTVRLWDVSARTCVGVLTLHTGTMTALAALPDGRLASGSADGTIRLWDTRPTAAARASHAVGAVPVEVVGVLGRGVMTLLPLPDGRLACGGGGGSLCLLELPAPPYE